MKLQILLERIGNLNQGNHRTISLEKKLLFTIWMISKPESFLAAGDRFNLSKSSAHKIFYETSNLILPLMRQYIRWPENYLHTVEVIALEMYF